MSSTKKKCRQYSEEYLSLGFSVSPGNVTLPMCLVCEKIFSNDAMKPSKMKEHFERMHPDRKDKDFEYFKNLKEKFLLRSKTFFKPSTSKNVEGGLIASYNISHLIAKRGYPHTVAENLILPAMKEVISTVMKMDPHSVLKSIALSNSSVQRRIDEMAEDIKTFLLSELQKSKFAIQLDEATFGRINILMIYARYYSDKKEAITEEFLTAEQLETYSTGEHIFSCLKNVFEKFQIPISNIIAAATDGAPSMVGKYRGFLALLKQELNNDIRTVHCVLHRQHLVAKNINGNLHDILNFCIKTINKIKSKPLYDRLFAQLCDKNDEVYNNLLFHTEVRWLSKGNCLQRLVDIFDSVVEFLLENDKPQGMKILELKHHIFFLADMFSHFNNVQYKLQGKNINLIQVRTIILGFRTKIDLYITTLHRKDFRYFENLKKLSILEKDAISSEDVLLYTSYLKKLKEDLNIRFNDLESLEIPSWITDPFECEISELDFSLQAELIELKEDLELKNLFKARGYAAFWNSQRVRQQYLHLKNVFEPLLLAFPSSYLVEAGFSHLNNLLRKSRNRLNVAERGDLRIILSNFEPNISSIVSNHQAQCSH